MRKEKGQKKRKQREKEEKRKRDKEKLKENLYTRKKREEKKMGARDVSGKMAKNYC